MKSDMFIKIVGLLSKKISSHQSYTINIKVVFIIIPKVNN
jgi:hypothetical protein